MPSLSDSNLFRDTLARIENNLSMMSQQLSATLRTNDVLTEQLTTVRRDFNKHEENVEKKLKDIDDRLEKVEKWNVRLIAAGVATGYLLSILLNKLNFPFVFSGS